MADDLRQEDLVDDIGFDDESVKCSDAEFYKGVTNRTDRIGIVSRRVKRVSTHYKKGVGHVMCRSKPSQKNNQGVVVVEAVKALCCKKLPAPKVRCGVVIVQYSTDRQGDIDPNQPLRYQLMFWIFGEDKYVLIRSYNKEMPIDKNDIKIICSDSQFQKLQFMPARGSLWQKEKLGWKKEIEEEAALLQEKLPRFMGKALSDDEILEAVGSSSGNSPVNTTGTEQDLNSVLDGMV